MTSKPMGYSTPIADNDPRLISRGPKLTKPMPITDGPKGPRPKVGHMGPGSGLAPKGMAKGGAVAAASKSAYGLKQAAGASKSAYGLKQAAGAAKKGMAKGGMAKKGKK